MQNLKKADLIEYIRTLEHNYNVAVSFNEQQAINIEAMIKNGVTVQQTEPLTLEELRNMGSEPVYIIDFVDGSSGWELSVDAEDYFDSESRTDSSYGSRWAAYRSKPQKED